MCDAHLGCAIETWEVADLLPALVDKSLVIFDESTGRYHLLETVRQFARDRLLETEEGERWRKRHLDYFTALGEEAKPHLRGADPREWLERLDTEHDNVRAALEFSVETYPERGLCLAGAIWRFWGVHGHFGEGRSRLAELLTTTKAGEHTESRARALNGAGTLAWLQGDFAAARALQEESLAISRELGDRWGIATSLNSLGLTAYNSGDSSAARALYEESLAIFREFDDRLGVAHLLNNLGNVTYEQGDLAVARVLLEESLVIHKEIGNRRGTANSLNNLGIVVHGQGNVAAARLLYEESLRIRRELGDRQGISHSLGNLGLISFDQGDIAAALSLYKESLAISKELGDQWGIVQTLMGLAPTQPDSMAQARLWGAAERLREEIGAPIPPDERQRYERQVAASRDALGDDAFNAAWQDGRSMTLDQAIDLALEETP